jgi:hypothetical protein
MRRLNPVGSLLGLLLTILLFVGLGISLWFNRGLAFSPGAVTAKTLEGIQINGYSSHSDFEKQCGKCHDPLRTNVATKCLECHSDVQTQIQSGQGAHSQIATINQCATCHPEHKGRTFNPTLASFQKFDHSRTNFSLIWHQENYNATPMQCSECHSNTKFSVVDNQTCADCHSKQDKRFNQTHPQEFGQDCQGCHDGVDRMQVFSHSTTGFALDGKHAQIQCTDCHNPVNVKDTPKDCKSCHAEPAMHQGIFAQSCDTCHSTQAWSPITLNGQSFGHLVSTGFSLALHSVDYSKQAITCSTCHPKDLQTYDIQICINCHEKHDAKFMADHIQQYTSGCLTCHDGVDRLSNFQHANFFVLDGKHASLQCTDCHTNQVYRGTPSECWQCHKEPEIHTGIFGLKCYYCHDAQAWSPATLHQHGFPLNHGLTDVNSQLPCDTCHGANYIEYTCYTCHDHQQAEIIKSHLAAGIQQQDIPACAKCHPVGILTSDQKKP